MIVSACDAGTPPPEVVIRDSAGVRLVAYPADPPARAILQLSPEPIYRYGDSQGEYEFQVISLGALQPDGSAIVVDAGASEVLRIRSEGASHTLIARRGRGPGEVRRVSSVFVVGQDTVLIEDDGNTRISVFEPGGAFRSTNLGADPSITRALRALGMTSSDQLLMTTSSFNSRFTEPWLEGQLVRFDVARLVADTVGSYDLAPFTPREGPRNPFLPAGAATATAGRFVVGRSDRPELRWLSAMGLLEQVVRWTPRPRYPEQADLELFRERYRADLRRVNPHLTGEDLRRMIDDELRQYELDRDEPMPLFSSLHGDADGRVWLATYDPFPSAGVSGYAVVDHDGTWLGSVRTPESFRFLDAGYGRVLGVMKGPNDVQYVVVFRIEYSAS